MTPRMAPWLVLGLLMLITIRLAAQEPAGAAAQVRKLEEKWTTAYKQRDINILSTLLAEDWVREGNSWRVLSSHYSVPLK